MIYKRNIIFASTQVQKMAKFERKRLMDRLLDLSNNSIQYGHSMCPSVIRKLKVIVYFRKVFSLLKYK
jgi:hypothetical protein